MNIYEGLAEVKTLRARLDELAQFRRASNVYETGSTPDFRFDDLTDQIEKIFARITELKLAILVANQANDVKVGNEEMQLARAILELSNVRTRLGYVTEMVKPGRGGFGLLERERRLSNEVPEIAQKSKADLLKAKEQYEKRKNALDSAIQEANNKVALPI
ncbi:MAG: hypothetical protein KGI38_11115 [Thaumarchaeota archaeon]|nr:hypothetical protein [Nitrososphaerota archaeon]